MKKISHLFAMLLLFVTLQIGVSAETSITVAIDCQQIDFEVQPTIINGSTMVPLRAIFEALGASVDWNNSTKTVTSTKNDTTIELTIGSKIMIVNGSQVELNECAVIIDGYTLVPVRAISESFGCQVGWDGNGKLVSIINDSSKYTMLYAQGGRSKAFANNSVNAQLEVGWFLDEALTPLKLASSEEVILMLNYINSALDGGTSALECLSKWISTFDDNYKTLFFRALSSSNYWVQSAYNMSIEYSNMFDVSTDLYMILLIQQDIFNGKYSARTMGDAFEEMREYFISATYKLSNLVN